MNLPPSTHSSAKSEVVIFCSSFSADGFLVNGTSSGYILVWNLEEALKGSNPVFCWKAHSAAIYALAFCGACLISGGDDATHLWSWASITKGVPALLGDLKPPKNVLGLFNDTIETNGLSVDASQMVVYTATGDSNAYAWDIERQQCIQTFSGHTDYLHCVKCLPTKHQLLTGSEDGQVRVWDTREGTASLILDSAKARVVNPTDNVKGSGQTFISALDTDPEGNWMVCGGVGLHAWYLKYPKYSTHVPVPSVQAVLWSNGRILVGGNESNVYQVTIDGKAKVFSESSSRSVYTLQETELLPSPVIVSAGVGAVDIIARETEAKVRLSLNPELIK